jgi:hypothetical protein
VYVAALAVVRATAVARFRRFVMPGDACRSWLHGHRRMLFRPGHGRQPCPEAQRGFLMNMIYNSPNYCVVEFKSAEGEPFAGGYEIMDKTGKREIFLGGMLADKFRFDVSQLIATEPSVEEVDDFLSGFEGLMLQPLVLH